MARFIMQYMMLLDAALQELLPLVGRKQGQSYLMQQVEEYGNV